VIYVRSFYVHMCNAFLANVTWYVSYHKLFERDLTPHPQYVAAYEWMRLPEERGGIGAQAIIHLGCVSYKRTYGSLILWLGFSSFLSKYHSMHGTVEWLPVRLHRILLVSVSRVRKILKILQLFLTSTTGPASRK
jgi:hypothetical protein